MRLLCAGWCSTASCPPRIRVDISYAFRKSACIVVACLDSISPVSPPCWAFPAPRMATPQTTRIPRPSGTDGKGRDYWWETVILRWAAGTGRLADRAPLLFRPVNPGPAAKYFGVDVVDGDPVLSWDTQLGRICMHYPDQRSLGSLRSRPAPDSLNADAVVTVLWTEGIGGPELLARDAAHPGREYEPEWTDLARILGTPHRGGTFTCAAPPTWHCGSRGPGPQSSTPSPTSTSPPCCNSPPPNPTAAAPTPL